MSIFGTLIEAQQVENAVLSTVAVWLPDYLAETERQLGLRNRQVPRPPAPESLFGGIDFLSVEQDLCPSIIAVVQPTGEPELTGTGDYNQWFEIQIGTVVIGEDEHQARLYARAYAGMLTLLATQKGSFGGLCQRTRLTDSPRVSWLDPDLRTVCLTVATVHSMVDGSVNEKAGPETTDPHSSVLWPGNPDSPWPNWPNVTSVNVSVTADHLS